MKNVNTRSKRLLLTAMVIGLVNAPSLSAAAESWKAETVLISRQGDQTVVLAGKYVISDAIDIPRDAVTLIIGQGAEISLNPDTEHKFGTRKPAGSKPLRSYSMEGTTSAPAESKADCCWWPGHSANVVL